MPPTERHGVSRQRIEPVSGRAEKGAFLRTGHPLTEASAG
jgi:hypothetical protein